jgi:hypothetical protein
MNMRYGESEMYAKLVCKLAVRFPIGNCFGLLGVVQLDINGSDCWDMLIRSDGFEVQVSDGRKEMKKITTGRYTRDSEVGLCSSLDVVISLDYRRIGCLRGMEEGRRRTSFHRVRDLQVMKWSKRVKRKRSLELLFVNPLKKVWKKEGMDKEKNDKYMPLIMS